MKKIGKVIGLFLVVMLISITGCSKQASENSGAAEVDVLAEILKDGKITVASDFGAPPMQFRDADGAPTGFTVELIEKAADYLGVEVVWEDLAWESLIPSLKAGKVDLIAANMSMTLERMKSIRFTDPVMVTGVCIMSRADADDIVSWKDLDSDDKKMGTTMGSVHADYIMNTWGRESSQYESAADWVNELKQGRIDGVMDDELLLAQLVKNNPEFKLTDGYVRPDTYGWAFRQDASSDNLLNWFNWYLKWIKLTGEYNDIYQKYVGHEWNPNIIMD